MSGPAATKGRTRDVLEAIYTWVDEALNRYYSQYYVTTDSRFSVSERSYFPFVAIRVDIDSVFDDNFGRELPNTGSLVDYTFTLYAYQKYNDDPNDDNRDAHILAKRLKDWLERKNIFKSEMSSSGIYVIRDISDRESDPRIRGVARMIISGVAGGKREDSP